MSRSRSRSQSTTLFSRDGVDWTEEEEGSQYKIVVTKVYSFGDYNDVFAFVRDDDGEWVEAPADAPQGRVIEAWPLAARQVETRRGITKKTVDRPAEVKMRLPVRMVSADLADVLDGIACRGMKDGWGLKAADRTFYIALGDYEEVQTRLKEAGWTVVDKSVEVAEVEDTLAKVQAAAGQAATLLAEALSLAPSEETLDRLDELIEGIRQAAARAGAASRQIDKLNAWLSREPGRSADKALVQALAIQAQENVADVTQALEQVEQTCDSHREAVAVVLGERDGETPLDEFSDLLRGEEGSKQRWLPLVSAIKTLYPSATARVERDGLIVRIGDTVLVFSSEKVVAVEI